MKIVINNCWGGFGLSDQAVEMYRELSGKEDFSEFTMERDDPIL